LEEKSEKTFKKFIIWKKAIPQNILPHYGSSKLQIIWRNYNVKNYVM